MPEAMREQSAITPLTGSTHSNLRARTYQGCFWISAMVSRLAGSTTRMAPSSSFTSREAGRCEGNQ